MHPQIKTVISRLRFFTDLVILDLTSAQHTPMGKLLYNVYYRTNICDVVDRESRYGYPHNGGEHTFSFRGKPWDAVTMLELIKETMIEGKFGLTEEEREVASQLSFVSQEIIARKM